MIFEQMVFEQMVFEQMVYEQMVSEQMIVEQIWIGAGSPVKLDWRLKLDDTTSKEATDRNNHTSSGEGQWRIEDAA